MVVAKKASIPIPNHSKSQKVFNLNNCASIKLNLTIAVFKNTAIYQIIIIINILYDLIKKIETVNK